MKNRRNIIMKNAWEVIDDIHYDKNEDYYYWLNEKKGTYFKLMNDLSNFGFGEDYVFYDNGKIKWCEDLDIEHCDVSLREDYEIILTDRDKNSLIIGIKNGDAEQYLI